MSFFHKLNAVFEQILDRSYKMDKHKDPGGDTQQDDPTHPPHPHDDHHHDHPCPDHYHRCHATFHGYIDCPTHHCHPEPKRVTRLLSVPCGAQDPSPQVTAFLGNPVNKNALVTAILDLGHDGWLVVFSVDP